MTPPRPPGKCVACGDARVAWTKPRVDYCYACIPGGPLAPPPCSGCGSGHYFSGGLCVACHPAGPEHIEACVGCLAWGVRRVHRSRCWTCRWWRRHYVEGDCTACGRRTVISERRVCRLCWETARSRREPGGPIILAQAGQSGQQLWFANTQTFRGNPVRRAEAAARTRRRLADLAAIGELEPFAPVPWRQLALFDLPAPPPRLRPARAEESDLIRFCDQLIRDHAAGHGWTRKHTNDVRRTLRISLALEDTTTGMIAATTVLRVPGLEGNTSALSTIDVLAGAGLLEDDRVSPVERYFLDQIEGLPDPMVVQLRVWFDVMANGSTTAPRRRARHPETARLHIRALAPVLRVWAAQGHDSLASIEPADVVAALPGPGPRRHATDQGLRSLFGVLKAHRLVFVDPTRGVAHNGTNATVPLPMDTDAIRAALDSPDPAAALAVALVAFHALASRQVRALRLTDIVDGRLTLGPRDIPLAAPVLPRLAAWLDHRNRTWPATVNPHLFINRRTAPRLIEVSRPFPWKQVGLAPQTLREDRILDEVRATGGDIRRICELFDLSVEAAMRYTATIGPDSQPVASIQP